MADDPLAKARKELDDEFEQFRENLVKIHQAMSVVEGAGPQDDVTEALKHLEDVVKEVRTGGLLGSGAKGHREALERFRKLSTGG